MGVWVLGTTRVDGRERLARRDRVVLGVLVVHRGTSVSPDRLADALWGDAVPASGRKVVQGSIARLRRVLGRRAVETSECGYRLVLPPVEVDAWRFEDLVAEGRTRLDQGAPAAAVGSFDTALALWRGEPAIDLEGWPPAEGQLVRLGWLRAAAEERRVEALVQVGRFDEAVADASRLTAAEPFRERAWELLALALHGCGRRVDALRTLDRACRALRDELGAGAAGAVGAFAVLERRIRHGDPAPVAAPGATTKWNAF